MASHRLIFSFFLLFLLTGCSSEHARLKTEVAQLQSQNSALQKQVQNLEIDKKACLTMSDRYQRAASIYQGCTSVHGFLENFCPASAILNGRIAVANGFVGTGWPYWIALIGKFAAFSALIGFLSWALGIVVLKWLTPKSDTVREARALIQGTEARVASLEAQRHAAEDNLARTKARVAQEIAQAKEQQEEMEIELRRLEIEISELEEEIEAKRRDLDALNSF